MPLTACGLFGGSGDRADPVPGEVTPNTRGEYIDSTYLHVRLEEQDESEGPVPPNDHPVELSGEQVEAWLADLQVRPEAGGEPIALIPEKQLSQLSVIVAQALGDAEPDEDVVFHSLRKGGGGWFGSERRATTARAFYRDHALNLIFGDLDDFYSEQIDRSLQPLEPGFRGKPSELSGELIDGPQVAFVDDRPDWIRLDTTTAAVIDRPASPAPTSTNTAAVPSPPTTAAPTPQPAHDPRWTQLEERLLILDGLRRKGLITQEDYEAKKQELLEVLDL